MMTAGITIFVIGLVIYGVCKYYQPFDHTDPIPITLIGKAVACLLMVVGAVFIIAAASGS